MSLDLERRIIGIDSLGNSFVHSRLDKLILEYSIPENLKRRLEKATLCYLNKCLPDYVDHCESEEEVLEAMVKYEDKIPNITPNGMIVCKRHTVVEYNLLVSAFMAVINSLSVAEKVESWHIPLNLRIKFGKRNEENMFRHHPTEFIHSDSWAGESIRSVTTLIPIFGDTENNHVNFYSPPDDFEDSWLGHLPSYADGSDIANKYKKLPIIPKKGHLYLQDFGGLHSSHREESAGARISIDTTFVIKRPEEILEKEHEFRSEERATHEFLSTIGSDSLLYFPDDVNTLVDCEGGFKHPSNGKKICLS